MATKARLIAPCGMNCSICMAYLRDKNKCTGCRGPDDDKGVSILRCKIKNCEKWKSSKSGFCYECKKLPCPRLKQLDKRYRTKYHMSMIENLDYIKKNGIRKFVQKEKARWACPECGGTICVHRRYCYSCGHKI